MRTDCKQIRRDVLRISHLSKHGHIPSDFSVVEILTAIYQHMKHDPARPGWDGRDLCVLSKGHAALALYCILARHGYFPIEELDTFAQYESKFGCHPDRLKIPGIEASTGSLGHGVGIAAGMALGCRIREQDRRVYVIVGDGEANEGSVWEAVLVAADLKLANLTIIFDYNQSHPRGLQISRPEDKFRAFGAQVHSVDGHDVDQLIEAFEQPCEGLKVVVANTVKGYGCQTLIDNMYEWHGKTPDDQQLSMLLEELDAASV